MPEGHTLHRLAREIDLTFGGRRVRVESPQGRFADSAASLDRSLLRGAEAAGKHLFLEFSRDRWVHIHLGLIGTFQIGEGPAPQPRGAVRLRLRTREAYADLRGPIICRVVTAAERAAVLDRLGPDPLRAGDDPEHVWQRISRSRRPIGVLLLQQETVAGLGNVYRAEVLFRHGVDPEQPGNELDHDVWTAMWDDLVELMQEGVRTGRIDTVRPEHAPEAMGRPPRVDDHGGEVYVYRRAGLPCLVCSTPVATRQVDGRNLFWCPGCQPGHRSDTLRQLR
ncbi:MAG TPA: DNA-formamidopyrimidine glycosylase family protein [Nocardioidaceae bacterium]|nr:DNA-formamidopyrimidine glycosylase family protein [Nocardioidaceae bacterium]